MRLKYRDIDSSFVQRQKYYSAMGGTKTYTGSSSQNTWMISQMKAHGYEKGSKYIPYDQMAWTQENGNELIYRASDGAVLTHLGEGDMVFTNEMSKRLWEMAQGNFVPNIAPIQTPDFSKIGNTQNPQNMSIGDINVNMNLPNVSNYNDLRNQLIKDGTFEKAMFTSINHALTGKGTSLDKLKYVR